MKTKEFRLDVKNLAEDGTFEGYGSIFGNVDCYRESVVKGAFSKSLKKHEQDNNPVLMLWQHSWEDPIGVWKELKEDDRGLYGVGEINLDVQKGREAYSLMKQRALTGLSIGYKEVKYTDNAEVRLLEEIDLYEISPVTWWTVAIRPEFKCKMFLSLMPTTPLFATKSKKPCEKINENQRISLRH